MHTAERTFLTEFTELQTSCGGPNYYEARYKAAASGSQPIKGVSSRGRHFPENWIAKDENCPILVHWHMSQKKYFIWFKSSVIA